MVLAAKSGDFHMQALALGNIGSAIAFDGDLDQAMLFSTPAQFVRAMAIVITRPFV